MTKIALIGVGSYVFGKDMISDLLLYPNLKGSTFSLMDIDEDRLELAQHMPKNWSSSRKLI